LQDANKVVRKVEDVQDLMINPDYERLFNELEEISIDMNLKLTDEIPYEKSIHLSKADEYLNLAKKQIKKIKEVQYELIKEKDENEKTLELLEHINDTQINLDSLSELQYVTVRFGRLKKNKVNSLKYIDKPYILHRIGEDKEYVWVCYIALNSTILEIDNLMKALAFEDIQIPDFVHGTIEDGKEELKRQIYAMHEYILRMDAKITALRESMKIDLLKLYSTLKYLLEVEKQKKYIIDFKNTYAFYAFVPKFKLNKILESFQDVLGLEYHQLPSTLLNQQGLEAPQVIHNYFWAKPFESLSSIKADDMIDTTMSTAIFFYIVSCLVLGDIGIGCLFLLLGFLMKNNTGKILKALSIPLLVGGILMGSVFYINIYPTLFTNIPAVYRVINGLVLLFCGNYTIQSIKEMYVKKPLIEKLLSLKGVCGIVALYTLMIYLLAVYEIHLNISVIPFIIILALCLILMMLRIINKKIR
jgi:vacuolar-type H+-ATPase subunit I/STV1